MFTIDELQAKLAGGATAVSLAEESLNKIESTKNLNAYISVLNERALQKAAESDKRRAEGKTLGALDGIPVAVKDNMCIEGTRTTAASKILENFVAPYTATAIEKLEAAGAVIVGKTNMDEFAMGSSNETSYFGKVVNPLDETRVPGGSSGGSAVAVASGTVACALGSDTGGSIRQPAACTGVVGLKPTYGRVSRYGLLAYASSLDQIGPFGATVKDTATLLGAICGIDPHDNTTSTRPTEDFTAKLDAGIGFLTETRRGLHGGTCREEVLVLVVVIGKEVISQVLPVVVGSAIFLVLQRIAHVRHLILVVVVAEDVAAVIVER